MANLKSRSKNLIILENDNNSLIREVDNLNTDLDSLRREYILLSSDLENQKILYNELKKMRGQGDEMDLLQLCQNELNEANSKILELKKEVEQNKQFGNEKIQLLREIAQLRKEGQSSTTRGLELQENNEISSPEEQIKNNMRATEAALVGVCGLRSYKVMLGVFFITIVINYILTY